MHSLGLTATGAGWNRAEHGIEIMDMLRAHHATPQWGDGLVRLFVSLLGLEGNLSQTQDTISAIIQAIANLQAVHQVHQALLLLVEAVSGKINMSPSIAGAAGLSVEPDRLPDAAHWFAGCPANAVGGTTGGGSSTAGLTKQWQLGPVEF